MHHNIGMTENDTTNRNDNMSQVSLTKGYWFYFDHEGNDISMFGSTWNGKETVYFNNRPVSSFRNMTKLKSEHSFTENGHQYEIKTEMKSIWRGALEVQLYCDGELIGTENASQVEKGTKGKLFNSFFTKRFLISLIICFCIGFAIGYFDIDVYNMVFG